jgi:hypothetical protein
MHNSLKQCEYEITGHAKYASEISQIDMKNYIALIFLADGMLVPASMGITQLLFVWNAISGPTLTQNDTKSGK